MANSAVPVEDSKPTVDKTKPTPAPEKPVPVAAPEPQEAIADDLEQLELVAAQPKAKEEILTTVPVEKGDSPYSLARYLQNRGYIDSSQMGLGELAKEIQSYLEAKNGGAKLAEGQVLNVTDFKNKWLNRNTSTVEMQAAVPPNPTAQNTADAEVRSEPVPNPSGNPSHIPGASYPAASYNLQANETLFRALLTYRETLPQQNSPQANANVMLVHFATAARVMGFNFQENSAGKMVPNISPNTEIPLGEIFSEKEFQETLTRLKYEKMSCSQRAIHGPKDIVPMQEINKLAIEGSERIENLGLSFPASYIAGLARQESSQNRLAQSCADAHGLLQLREIAVKDVFQNYPEVRNWSEFSDLEKGTLPGVEQLQDPKINTLLSAVYLGHLNKKLGNPELAVYAYNRGITATRGELRQSEDPLLWQNKIYAQEGLGQIQLVQQQFSQTFAGDRSVPEFTNREEFVSIAQIKIRTLPPIVPESGETYGGD